MKASTRITIGAAQALATAILTALVWPWVARVRRKLRRRAN